MSPLQEPPASTRVRTWLSAARPATLWAAVAPVLVGSALAVADGVYRWDAFLVILVAAVAIQIGVNFANDAADAARGADSVERIGPQRAVAAGLISSRRMLLGAAAAFGVATVCGAYLIYLGGPWILVIGIASILAALGYTNGPVPYGYIGLGEVFVFIFFGLAATVGTRFVYDRTAPGAAWVAGAVMGFLAVAILIANNWRDIDSDRAAGKRTLAVRMGRTATRALFVTILLLPFAVTVMAVAAGVFPAATLLSLIALIAAMPLIGAARNDARGTALIPVLKATARLQLLVALLLSAGFLV